SLREASYHLRDNSFVLASSLCIFLIVAIFFIIKFPTIPTTIPPIIPAKDKMGSYNMTVKDCAIKLATTNRPTLKRIPPVVIIPIKLTLSIPSFRTSSIPKKIKYDPAKLYINVDKVPPNKEVSSKRMVTTLKLSLKDKEKIATKVTIFANPIFAPGANAKRLGNIPSTKDITVAWAAKSAI